MYYWLFVTAFQPEPQSKFFLITRTFLFSREEEERNPRICFGCCIILRKMNPTWFFVVMRLMLFLAAVEMPFKQHDGLDGKIRVDFLCVFVKCHFLHQICFSFSFPPPPSNYGVIIIITPAPSSLWKCEEWIENENWWRIAAKQQERKEKLRLLYALVVHSHKPHLLR